MNEKGHNWLLVYSTKEKALEYLKSFCSNTTAIYVCGYTVTIEGIEQYEVLIQHSIVCTIEKLKPKTQIVIKQYGTRYSVFQKCVNIETIFYEYGTRPVEKQNTMEDVISSFMDNEGDTESMYYKRYKTYLDSIRSKYVPLEGKVQLFGTTLIEKNILVYGGNETKRNEYIEEITRGHNVYIKKTDKYWYKYQHEEFVIIKEISQLSFKKIVSNLLLWSGSEEYEAEIYHNKIKMYPKDYRLIVSLKFNPNALKKVSEEEKLLLTRFKMIELENDENEEENNKEEPNEVTKIIKSIDTSKAITDNKPFIRKKSSNTKESKSVKLSKPDDTKEKKSITNKKSITTKEESTNQNNSTSILQILKPTAIKDGTNEKDIINEKDKKEEGTLSTSNLLPPTIQSIQRVSTIKKDEPKEESKKRDETTKSTNTESMLLRKSTPYEDTVSFETYQRIQNEVPIKRTNSPILKKTIEFEDTNDMIIEEDTSNDETKKMNFENNTLDDIIIHEKKREHKHKSEHHHKKEHKKEHKKDHLKEHKHCKEHHHKKRIENKKKEGTKPKKCTTAEKIYNEIETKKYRINLFDGF